MTLNDPIETGGRALKMYASRLEKLEIFTIEDLLYHIPFRYDDYSLVSKIGQLQAGETATIIGEVMEIKNTYLNKFKTLQKSRIADDSGHIDVTWFNQPFLIKSIKSGDRLSLSGKVVEFAKRPQMQSPDYEILTSPDSVTLHTGRLVPVYPETRGVSSKWLRRQIYNLLHEVAHDINDFLPEDVVKKHSFPNLEQALREVHFPKSLLEAERARNRLAFNELFLLQLKGYVKRAAWKNQSVGNAFEITKYEQEIAGLITSLPFTLTQAQDKALKDILADLSLIKPMNRLLQGDVGSGKTVVAAIAGYVSFLNGFQSVIMAPTEILAEQHYKTLEKLLSPFGVRVGITTGSIKYKVSGINKNDKKNILNTQYSILDTDILVGTHAVLSEKIQFKNLGLVVIDEQQRFGVEQRSVIRKKGNNPHLLTMTATPIPRTIALTMYGDLDLSYLNEMPKGRQVIKTWLVPHVKREASYQWIREEIKKNSSQVFIICPFIEESENMQTVKAATKEFERLSTTIYPDLKLGMLHGRQKAKEKEAVLSDFREKKFDILVATPVVEVGIDIPNATVIVIEAAERFGLAQLHQLRGRVGRGDKQSYCLLFTESLGETTQKRLKAMETSHVGSELAELDLKLRGPGELYGTRQSGSQELKIANFSDSLLIEQARNEASSVFHKLDQYPEIKKLIAVTTSQDISPD